jgi:nitrate/nitrite-specific signal transduction histidine kinase
MLRRKLLFLIGPLMALLVATSALSMWLLQGILDDVRHIKDTAWTTVEAINELSVRVQAVQVHLYALQTARSTHLDALIEEVDATQRLIERLGESYLRHERDYSESFARLDESFPVFRRHVGSLATAQNLELARLHNEAAMSAAVAMQQQALPMGRVVHQHAQAEQEDVLARFRWLVLGLSLLFLLVINVAVVLLLRSAGVILKPIDRLVAATRELSAGHYDYRVELDQQDEFGQLARAYNHLAQQLQDDEKQRMEMLGHVSLTMNHEINNAAAIIQMQLRLMHRQQAGTAQAEKSLQQIHQSLARMTAAVQALKEVRRIVLTDYADGMKMLDLAESVKAEPNPSASQPAS